MVWTQLPFIRSGQTIVQGTVERGEKTRQTEEEVGRRQGMDRPGVRQVPESSKKKKGGGEMEETGCEVNCGAPTTLAVRV